MVGVVSCLSDPNHLLRDKAIEAILKIFDPAFISAWDGSNPDWRENSESQSESSLEASMKTFWRVSSQVMLSLSRQAIEIRGELLDPTGPPAKDAKSYLDLILQLLKRRNEFLSKRIASFTGVEAATVYKAISVAANTPDRFGSSVSLEMALLVFLCSSDLEISYLAVQCLSLIMDEAELTGEGEREEIGGDPPSDTPAASPQVMMNTVAENGHVFAELKKLAGSGATTGQKALQKRLRKLLRLVSKPTAGNMGAWDEVYKRWKVLSVVHTTVINPSSSLPDDDGDLNVKRKKATPSRPLAPMEFTEDRGDWQNYTGFLAALGGVCLNSSLIIPPAGVRKNNFPTRRPSQSGGTPAETSMPDHWSTVVGMQLMSAYSDAKIKVENFLAEMVELSICDNIMVREAVKELLGNELNSGLYGILDPQRRNSLQTH